MAQATDALVFENLLYEKKADVVYVTVNRAKVLNQGLLIEASLFGLCAATEDKTEGTSAFLAKRAPNFHGR
jgi:1,4-dihydroxy-2-naphthoyl-CoA synthase